MVSFTQTTISCNNSLHNLLKPTGSSNQMSFWNFCLWIQMSLRATTVYATVHYMPIGVPLSYTIYVVAHYVDTYESTRQQVMNEMLMNVFGNSLLNCDGCIRLWRVLLENMWTTMCYRSNPDLAFRVNNSSDSTMASCRKKFVSIRWSSLLITPPPSVIFGDAGNFLLRDF